MKSFYKLIDINMIDLYVIGDLLYLSLGPDIFWTGTVRLDEKGTRLFRAKKRVKGCVSLSRGALIY